MTKKEFEKIESIRQELIEFEFETDDWLDLDFISRIINELNEITQRRRENENKTER